MLARRVRRTPAPAAAVLPPIPDLNRVFGSRVAPPEPTYMPDPPAPPRQLAGRFVRLVASTVAAFFAVADVVIAIAAGGKLRVVGVAAVTALVIGALYWRLVQLPKPFEAPTEVPRRRWRRN